MSNIRVTNAEISRLMETATKFVRTVFGKCTVVTVQLENGFILTESSACVDPDNYDMSIGTKLCLEHIRNRLWELEGYALQKKEYERDISGDAKSGDFSWAIQALKEGKAVRRKGWNGKNQFVQIADSISYCRSGIRYNPTHKNIGNRALVFVGTSGEQMGWLASQADMLADDWELAELL